MEALSSSLYLAKVRVGKRLRLRLRQCSGGLGFVSSSFVPALVEVGGRVLARAHAAHRGDGRRELLARPERGDAHLAQVGGSELDLVEGG